MKTWNVLDKDGNLVGVFPAESSEEAVSRCNEGMRNNKLPETAVSAEERGDRPEHIKP